MQKDNKKKECKKLFKLDKKFGANCVSLYTENRSQFLNKRHFGHKAVKLAFALFQHAEILAEILRIQRICVTKMLANRGRRIFTLMQMQTCESNITRITQVTFKFLVHN